MTRSAAMSRIRDRILKEILVEDKSIPEIFTKEIAEGYIDKTGKPLKCICGCKEFITNVMAYEGTLSVEEEVLCSSCKELVAHWSYGQWFPCEIA